MRARALLARVSWEVVLLVAAVAAVWLLASDDVGRKMLIGSPSQRLILEIGIAVLLGGGLTASIRVAAPNLAVGAVAASAGVLSADLVSYHGLDVYLAMGIALVGCLLLGLLLAALVAVRIPSWAASLAAALLLTAGLRAMPGAGRLEFTGGPDVQRWDWLIVGIIAGLAAGIGVLLWTPAGAAALGLARRFGDPGSGTRAGGGWLLAGMLAGSCLAAGLGGLLAALWSRQATVSQSLGVEQLAPALMVALIAAPSLRSGRGALAGVVLAAIVVCVGNEYLYLRAQRSGNPDLAYWLPWLVSSAVAALGLLVARGLDALPPAAPATPDDDPVLPALPAGPSAAVAAGPDADAAGLDADAAGPDADAADSATGPDADAASRGEAERPAGEAAEPLPSPADAGS